MTVHHCELVLTHCIYHHLHESCVCQIICVSPDGISFALSFYLYLIWSLADAKPQSLGRCAVSRRGGTGVGASEERQHEIRRQTGAPCHCAAERRAIVSLSRPQRHSPAHYAHTLNPAPPRRPDSPPIWPKDMAHLCRRCPRFPRHRSCKASLEFPPITRCDVSCPLR